MNKTSTSKLFESRCLIIDWAIDVCKDLKFEFEIFEVGVNIFDSVIKTLEKNNETKKNSQRRQLFLLMVSSLVLAIKYQIIYSFSFQSVINLFQFKGTFSIQELKGSELFILKTLKFKIPQNHFKNFSSDFFHNIIFYNNEININLSKNINFNKLLIFSEIVYKIATLKCTININNDKLNLCSRNEIYFSILYVSLTVFKHLFDRTHLVEIFKKIYQMIKREEMSIDIVYNLSEIISSLLLKILNKEIDFVSLKDEIEKELKFDL
jgi:hypothetical protein